MKTDSMMGKEALIEDTNASETVGGGDGGGGGSDSDIKLSPEENGCALFVRRDNRTM